MQIIKVLFISLLYIKNIKCENIIVNKNIPACRNCIYHKPNRNDFTSTLSLCEKFGEKSIITDNIEYEFVNRCRNDESKCGKNGKYFEEEPNIQLKIAKHYFVKSFGTNLFIISCIMLILYSV